MSSVWGMILQWGSTIKVSMELPVATRHRRDMTEELLKVTLKAEQTTLPDSYVQKMQLRGKITDLKF